MSTFCKQKKFEKSRPLAVAMHRRMRGLNEIESECETQSQTATNSVRHVQHSRATRLKSLTARGAPLTYSFCKSGRVRRHLSDSPMSVNYARL